MDSIQNTWEDNRPVNIYSSKREMPLDIKNVVVGRYFSFFGFLNMLENSELYFKKISLFEDQAEGIPQYREWLESIKRSRENVGEKYAEQRKENVLATRDNYYASCWVKNDHESFLMWKNYTDYKEGILVLSTIGQLINSLEIMSYEKNNLETVNWFFGEIDYGYKKTLTADHIKAFGKGEYFQDENEFRIVIYRDPKIKDEIIKCPIKNFAFINNIICSPGATGDFIELIKKVVVNKSISSSIVKVSEIKQISKEILDNFINTQL